MLCFYVSEQSRITKIGFTTRTNIISVIRIVPPSSPVPLLVVLLNVCWKHYYDDLNIKYVIENKHGNSKNYQNGIRLSLLFFISLGYFPVI